jgi:hypothetical protein
MRIFGIGSNQTQHWSQDVTMSCGSSIEEVKDRESGDGEGNDAQSEIPQSQVGSSKDSRRSVQRPSSQEEDMSLGALQ